MSTNEAPASVGPYSQAVVHDGWLFASGQIPLDVKSGRLVEGDIAVQTRQVLDNLHAVLTAAGMSFRDVVKTTIYMTDLSNFATMNTVYSERFGESVPARATVQVAALPLGSEIEIDLIARCA